MATEEKKDFPSVVQTPPEYSSVARGQSVRKSTMVLGVYASAVTALLLALAIFGSVMYTNVLRDCATDDKVATPQEDSQLKTEEVDFDDDGKKVTEQSQVDANKELEIIRLGKTGEKTDGATIVLDYKRRMTGMYLPVAGECYVIGGVNHDLRSPFRKTGEDDDKKKPEEKKEVYTLKKADDYPMADTDILPKPLHDTCEDKDTYWLERTTEQAKNGTTSRDKRCAYYRYCYRYCCYWGWYGCYSRCYRCYYYLLC